MSGRGAQRVCKGEVEPRDTVEKATRNLKIPRRWITFSLRPRIESMRFEVEQRGDSPVLVMHDGVTKSIFAQLIPTKRVDFASCENVLKMMITDLDNLEYHRVVCATMSPPFLHYSGR